MVLAGVDENPRTPVLNAADGTAMTDREGDDAHVETCAVPGDRHMRGYVSARVWCGECRFGRSGMISRDPEGGSCELTRFGLCFVPACGLSVSNSFPEHPVWFVHGGRRARPGLATTG